MATGLKMPITVDEQGHAATVSKADLVKQLLITSLRDCSSLNPFQDLGLGDQMVFDINDRITAARIMQKIKDNFARFEAEDLAKLDANRGLKTSTPAAGEMEIGVTYIDLESNRPMDITIRLPKDLQK